jgi:polysaccharide pyruvyl transferase WcaK-like protein
MKITIIGWYGTETIGDRAVLTGLISFFHKSFSRFELNLGSLYPFFSERTLNEDYFLYKEVIGRELTVNIFNSKNSKELFDAIKSSDLLVMGGGPLMDLDELYMVEYAFKKAKKLGVKTALFGCGVGPLFHKKYRRSVLKISLNTDLHVLRDSQSKVFLSKIYAEFKETLDLTSVYTSFDPSVECALWYKQNSVNIGQEFVAVNVRSFPSEYGKTIRAPYEIDNNMQLFIQLLANRFIDREIKLIPMHYFHIGGDDRAFLNKIALELKLDNVSVQNKNLTLKETLSIYSEADFNVGMRFHAVVLQTIVSGRNYALDYTQPGNGKINSFFRDIDKKGFYKKRSVSLQEGVANIELIENIKDSFIIEKEVIDKVLNVYAESLEWLRS